jgi:hypothetical protein
MTITEHKFPSGAQEFPLELPVGCQLLQPRAHGPQPVLPVLGDPKAPKQTRTFLMFGQLNAANVPNGLDYVGSFDRAGFPYHVFERKAAKASA